MFSQYHCTFQVVVYYFTFFVLISEVGFALAGNVVTCAGVRGKVLVPGGGNDDLLSNAEPAVDTPEQPEELKVPQWPDVYHVFMNTYQMSDEIK